MKKQANQVFQDVKSFVVDRERWYRGKGDRHSKLLNRNNKQCCLGFYALACGLSEASIKGQNTPNDVICNTESCSCKSNIQWKTKLIDSDIDSDKVNSQICQTLMEVNDEIELSDEERETKLTKLFKKIGIKVKFQ